MGAKYFGAVGSAARRIRGCFGARGASSTTSRSPVCSTRRSLRSPHAHARIVRIGTARGARQCLAWSRCSRFADLARWFMKPLAAVWGGAAAGWRRPFGSTCGRWRRCRCVGISRVTWARSSRWWWRTVRERAGGRGGADRGRVGAAAAGRRHGRGGAEPGGAARASGVGRPTWPSAFATAFGDADAAFAGGADVVRRETLPRPALRRHADRDARRGRPVGRARRHAHDVEHAPRSSHFVQQGLGRGARSAAPPGSA